MSQDIHSFEAKLALILIQISLIILAARLAGAAAVAVRQPRAVGEIVAGLLLGPSLFGWLFPEVSQALFTSATFEPKGVIAQIGLLLLMFQIGSEFEYGHLQRSDNQRAVGLVALFSLVVPFAAGFALGQLSAPILAPSINPLAYSLFVAVALAITAVPILGRILKEFGLMRQEVGVIAITAAAINDVVGWLALAIVAAIVTSGFSPEGFGLRLLGLFALLAGLWVLGRPLADYLVRRFLPQDGGQELPGALLAIVIALIFAAGVTTQALGIFTIFGGFLVGLLFHRHTGFVAAWQRQVAPLVLVFFLPIFFTLTGLRTNVLGLDTATDWLWCAGFFAVSVGCKIIPVYIAGRLAGLPHQPSAALGVLMNTRALMELIVLNIGLSLGVIPQDVFTMLVIMAIGTTLMTGPLLHLFPQVTRGRVVQDA